MANHLQISSAASGELPALDTGPRTAADIARDLLWTRRKRSVAGLGPLHQQFAVAETLAHLEHLHTRGAVRRDDRADPIVSRSTTAAG